MTPNELTVVKDLERALDAMKRAYLGAEIFHKYLIGDLINRTKNTINQIARSHQ